MAKSKSITNKTKKIKTTSNRNKKNTSSDSAKISTASVWIKRQEVKLRELNKKIKETLKNSKKSIFTQISGQIGKKISAKDIVAVCQIGNVVEIAMGQMGSLITNEVHLFCEMDAMKHKPCALRHWTRIYHHRFHNWSDAIVMLKAYLISLEDKSKIEDVVEQFQVSKLASDETLSSEFYDAVKYAKCQIK